MCMNISHGIIIHNVAPYFIGIVIVSISGSIHHKRVGEGRIDDTGFAASAQSSIEIMPTKNKDFSPDIFTLFY
jgi:hypothetical protein